MTARKRLTRSTSDRMLGGVCAGIGEYFDLDPTLIRLGAVLLFFAGVGSPLLAYLVLWIIVPPDDAVYAGSDRGAGDDIDAGAVAQSSQSADEPDAQNLDEAGESKKD